MMDGIFDSHTHYDDEAFDADRGEILAGLPALGVSGIVNCGCSLESSRKSLEIAEQYEFAYAACGVHPHEAAGRCETTGSAELSALLSHKKCVALGEIGLDYHYDFSPRDAQRKAFEQQLALAAELGLPVIVHDREAHEDTMRLLKKYKPRGVLHCYSGSVETMREAIGIGLYIGLGGAVTFKNAKKPLEAARAVPAERLLIETDCPYMAPVPYRGKRCTSDMIALTARAIAGARGIDAREVLDITRKNAEDLFGIRRI